MAERIIFEVDFNLGEARKNVIAFDKTLLELKQAQKELEASFKAGELSTEGYASAMFDLKAKTTETKNAQKEYQRQIDLTTKANTANAGSYQQISAQLALESAELRKLKNSLELQEDGTYAVSKAYDAQFDKVRKLKEAQLAFDGAIKDGRTNVGNYEDAVKSALDSFSIFGVNIKSTGDALSKGFTGAVGVAKTALNQLYVAILANPITAIFAAIFVVLTTVIGAFASTEKGGNKVAETFARFKPIIDAVYSALAGVGEVVFMVVEGFAKLVAFVGGFEETAEASAKLTRNLQNVEKELLKINTLDKQQRQEAERLKSIRDDESKSFPERIKANERLGEVERNRLKAVLEAENRKLEILAEQLKRTPENLRTTEQLKAVEEQRAKIAEITEDFNGRITEQITNQVSLLRDQLTAQADLSDALFKQQLLQGRITEGSSQDLAIRKKSADARLDIELKQFDKENKLAKLSRDERLKILAERDVRAKVLITNTQNEALELEKDYREKQVELYQDYLDKIDEQRKKYLEEQVAGFELELEKTVEGTKARLEAEKALITAQSQSRIETEKLTGNSLLLEREKLKNALSEKDKAIGELELNEIRTRLQTQATLQSENADAQIRLLQFNSNRRIIDEKLTGEALKAEIALTEKAISDIRKAESDKQILNKATANKAEIDNQANKEKVLFDAQKFAIEQDITTQAEKDARILELRKNSLAQLALAEQEQARAQFEFDLEFTATTEAQKEALKIQYAQQSIDIERKYADEKIAIDKTLEESELAKLENTQAVFGSLKGLFGEQSLAYKVFASTEALIATYLAANKALASAPPPIGAILAGITTAQGLLNVGKINGLKFAKGGIFGGESHANGGTKGYFSDGTQIEVEAGEAFAIVNKKNTPMLKMLSRVNSAGGNGVPFFQNGGVMSSDILSIGQSMLNTSASNEAIIRSLPTPILRISDLYEVENNIAVSESISNQ